MSDKFENYEVNIRPGKKEDMKAVAEMIQKSVGLLPAYKPDKTRIMFQELADFEKMPEGPKMSVEELENDGFVTEPPAFRSMVAELPTADSTNVVGYALYFPTYSTWEGRSLMLEDLYVRPDVRRKGVGAKLFKAVAKEASATGCSRLDFHVLEWNPARAFYENKGAVNLTSSEQWCYYRLAGDALRLLA